MIPGMTMIQEILFIKSNIRITMPLVQLVSLRQLDPRRPRCRLCRRQQVFQQRINVDVGRQQRIGVDLHSRFDVTRVTFTVPLREHFSLPFIFSQVMTFTFYMYHHTLTFTFCLQFGSVGHYLANTSRESSNETFQLAIIFLTRFPRQTSF